VNILVLGENTAVVLRRGDLKDKKREAAALF
jgi:hypothetical protein